MRQTLDSNPLSLCYYILRTHAGIQVRILQLIAVTRLNAIYWAIYKFRLRNPKPSLAWATMKKGEYATEELIYTEITFFD